MKVKFSIAGAFVIASALLLWRLPVPEVLRKGHGAVVIHDARAAILREPAGSDGLRAEWVALDEVPKALRDAVVASEDHRLGAHPGVDPWGVLRAIWLDLHARSAVSGASTLAMQLARLAYNLPRTPWGKLQQAWLGVHLQLHLGARGVLEAYLNLAPYGRDVRGVRAASRAYFGKPLQDLTLGEQVALACLPRGPSHYDPYRHASRLVKRRAHVLGLMEKRGFLDATRATAADREVLTLARFERWFRAPHASALAYLEATQRGGGIPSRVYTTIDPSLQSIAQEACRAVVHRLTEAAATDCAAVVLKASTSEVLALVGSPDFRSPDGGQVNAALALRQPGSALKPFVYGLAFELGRTPASLIEDLPTELSAPFGTFTPSNYDGRFHGQITLREALANSYNIPALKVAQEVGVEALLKRLRELGLSSLTKDAGHYGVGLALGDGEVRLLDLTAAYASLARGGSYLTPTLLERASAQGRSLVLKERLPQRVFSEEVSYMVGHVLADRAARRAAFGAGSVLDLPFEAAVKTGTSSDFRDNWTFGYAGDVVVGVWVGRHDGAPMHGVSGVAGAAPAFRRIMLAAADGKVGAWPRPPASVSFQQLGTHFDLTLARR